VNDLLDPKRENQQGDHAGRNIRESLDSEEHPNSTPIVILFDVTGSMGFIPAVLQRQLPNLLRQLQEAGTVEDPQILFGAIGDAYSDHLPIQVGQFESDNRMDEQLESMVLEGGGGGGNHESYELALYWTARHTYIDSFEKRAKRGHLFVVGDERVYATVNHEQVRTLIGGDSEDLGENISTEAIYRELSEKWNVTFVFAQQGSYSPSQVLDRDAGDDGGRYGGARCLGWKALNEENILIMDDAERICELIGRAVSVAEGTNIPV
jgi:hypothetical protein